MQNFLNFNFKSTVQSKERWLLTLFAILTLGVGQMWGYDFTSGKVIYFDNTEAWSKCYLRVGHTTWNSVYQMSKVSNTLGLYSYTIPSWGGYAAYAIANNCGWADGNSIYKVKTGDGNAITASTVYIEESVSANRTIWPSSWKNKDEDCDYYNVTNNSGLTTYKVTRSVTGSGTLAIKYTSNGSGTMTTSSAASSGYVNVIRSGNVEVTATPSSGYALTALSLGGKTFTKDDLNSGHYDFSGVREARTLSATFTAISSKTIRIKDTDGWGGIKVYMWNDVTGAKNAAWPGVAATAYNGSSVWYTVTLSTEYTHFIISRTGYTGTKSNDIPISSATAGYCYTTTTGDLPAATPCADAPTVSTNNISTYNLTSATLGGNISNDGSDVVSEYGYYYSTSSTLSSANAASVGTKVTVGTDDKDGSFSQSKTGLSMGTTYYVIAFATNPHGTGWGTTKSFTTTAPSLTLTPTVNYEGNSVSISTSTNLDGSHGFSGTKCICCECVSKPGGAGDPSVSLSSTTLNITGVSTDGQYIFAVSLRDADNCGGDAYVSQNCTITMRTIPDRSSLTINHAKYNSTYMSGNGASATPYFVYLSRATDYGKLNLTATLPAALLSGETLYYSVDGTEKGTVTVVGTSASVTMDLPNKTAGDKRSTTIKFYSKLDGQAASDAKKASATVYYHVCANPVVTVSATYNDEEIAGEIPQNAEITVSASATNIAGEPTFQYKKGSGAYSSTTTYTLDAAGTTTMYAKTTALGDTWEGSLNVTTYAANAVTYVTSKTDMYGDVATTSTSRLFKSSGEEHTAAEIAGYTFTGWTCSNSNVQVSDNGSTWKSSSSNATVYVKATAAGGTLTARYTENKRIYFDNSKAKWTGDIYVYFFSGDAWYNDYNGTDKNGPGVVPRLASRIGYGQMTRIGSSDVYYYEYGALSFTRVAFSVGNQYNYDMLYNTKGAWRTDFSSCNPCYVAPETSDQTKYNTGGSGKSGDNKPTYYYNNGYWRRYMPAKSGYTLHFADQEVAFLPEDPAVDAENFKVTVLRATSTTYPIYVNNSCMGKTWKNASAITKDNCSNLTLTQTSGTCNFTTTAVGDYVFRLSTANGQVKLTVEYPLSTGDYQVYYTDNTGKNNNYSNYIRKNSSGSTKKDTVSFFVKKTASPTFQIKRCTGFSGSTPTWENVGSATAISVAKDSVYNLIFQQDGTGTTISKVGQEFYSGNYYIRTDGAAGGWGNYLSNPDNKMKHTDKASALAVGYNYYYLRWIGDASGNSNANVKFCIATDYNNCVSQEHGNDPADGSLSGGQALTGKGANVRFTYHPGTNTTTRTCVGGSAHDDQYLVINGTNLKTSGDASWAGRTKMTDMNDWIYTYELKAANDATITLESHYNDKYVTILPTKTVLEVGDAAYYDLRIVYDYKTNEVVAAYIPSTVSSDLTIDVDIMFIRQAKDNHEPAPTTTLTLSGGAKITGDPKTLYGAIKFEKDYVRAEGSYSGLVTRRPERSTYWISFPFDVRIKDIFGLGDYTETWIIQRYRGDSRASKGWFLDTKTFWEYVMDENYVMKAGQGYVLSIDCEAIQWPNNQTTQYLYFPSKDKISDITSVLPSASMNVPEHTCSITSPADRTVKDSHWNVIGIPGFADAWGRATEDVSVIGGNLKYFYTWAPSTNTLSTTSTRKYNFKFMHSYMVQYYGNIDWSASEPAAIVAKRSSGTLQEEVEFCIDLMKDSIKEDNAFVTLMDNNRATTDFDMNTDLVKMLNAKNANIYTIINSDIQAAANCLPMTEQTTIVPVGVQIATNGTYTFTMPDGTNGVSVTLVDNEANTRTNLALTDYTVNLTAGTHDGRFLLEIAPIQQTPTGMEEVTGDGLEVTGARKVIIDQKMYIIRDGKMYDARGAMIK